VLTNVSLDIPSGRTTALVGPSGSGKSTLLGIISGLVAPDAGTLRFLSPPGEEVTPPRAVWVPQGSNCLPKRTTVANVAIGAMASGATRREANDRARAVLTDLGLLQLSNVRAEQLSGGELQRVAFARALARQGELILADEPTANLDAASARTVAAMLRDASAAATVVLATHDLLLADASDNVINLRDL
jgi:ABC-type lipoprotein export system ATPase subunit